MKTVLAPAEAMMNRLSYPMKFGFLGLVVVIAFASLMAALANELNATIDRTRRELVASALSRPLSKTVELAQQHRGMSASLLSGMKAIGDSRAAKEREVDAAFVEGMPADWRQPRADAASGVCAGRARTAESTAGLRP